jgi:hypothetical protein
MWEVIAVLRLGRWATARQSRKPYEERGQSEMRLRSHDPGPQAGNVVDAATYIWAA